MRGHTRSHTRDVLQDLAGDGPRTLAWAPRGGASMHARVYEPEGAIHGNVLIHSATACPQRFYAPFARHLSRAGLRVFTYDYRGVGASRGRSLRGETVTMADWAQVYARAMHEHIAQHHPAEPLALIGHSFGAQLIGLVDEARHATAAVFVGAQLGYYGHWPAAQAPRLRRIWKLVVPAFSNVLGYLPRQTGIGEDLPRGVALQWARWCTHPDYLMSEFPAARTRYASFDRPILAYSFSDDRFAPERAVAALHAELTSARITERRLAPEQLGVPAVGHFGFFRPGVGSALWDEASAYLLDALRISETRSDVA